MDWVKLAEILHSQEFGFICVNLRVFEVAQAQGVNCTDEKNYLRILEAILLENDILYRLQAI